MARSTKRPVVMLLQDTR